MSQEQKIKIEVKNIYKVFGRHSKRGVELHRKGVSKDTLLKKHKLSLGVADASFVVYEGETLVVMGLSGSGKSTLLRCVNRLIEPTSGTVIVDGKDVTKLDDVGLRMIRRKKFGMVFQHFALFPHMTVLQNTAFGLDIQGMEQKEREKKAAEALQLVGLGGYEDSLPGALSGGMKQRVGLARALAVDPDILLMDEAFSALDPLIRTDMQDELLSLEERVQKTILFITHDLDEALKMGDRIILMKDGAIVQIGTPEDILVHPANEYVQRFLENVDVTKVLTASDAMKRAVPVAFVKDGPTVALRKMREAGMSGLHVVRRDHQLVGYVTAEAAAEGAKRAEKWLDHVMKHEEIETVHMDTPVRNLFHLVAGSTEPVAVVDDENKLRGYLVKGSVLGALAERGDISE
ncbi:MAG: glycine betaine/L-proline ABC transporter ATP-binding protein [Spirochaetia bacterium]